MIISGWVGMVALIVLMTMVVVYIIQRQFLLGLFPDMQAWFFVDEYSAFIYVLLTYLALGYTLITKGHIRITLFTQRLPAQRQVYADLLSKFVAFITTVFLLYRGLDWMVMLVERGGVSPATRTPLFIPYIPVLAGLFLFALALLFSMVDIILQLKDTKKDMTNCRAS